MVKAAEPLIPISRHHSRTKVKACHMNALSFDLPTPNPADSIKRYGCRVQRLTSENKLIPGLIRGLILRVASRLWRCNRMKD